MSTRNDSRHSLHLKPADQVKVTLLIEPVSKQLAAIQAQCKTIVQQNRKFCDEKRHILDKVRRLKEKSEKADVLELSLRETEQERMKLLDKNTNLTQKYTAMESKLDLSNRGLKNLQQVLANKDKLISHLQLELSKERQRNQNLCQRVDQLTGQLSALSSVESPAKEHIRDSRYAHGRHYKCSESGPAELSPSHNSQGGRHTTSFQARNNKNSTDHYSAERNDVPFQSRDNRSTQDRNRLRRNSGHHLVQRGVHGDRMEPGRRYNDQEQLTRGPTSRSELMYRQLTSTPRRTLNPQFDDIIEDLFFQ